MHPPDLAVAPCRCRARPQGRPFGPIPLVLPRKMGFPVKPGEGEGRGSRSTSWQHRLRSEHSELSSPGIAARLFALLRDPSTGHLPSLTAAVQAAAYLHTQGFEAPAWGEALVDHAVPTDHEDEPEDFLRGWQRRAAVLATSAHLRRTFLNLPPRPERCCSRKLGPMLRGSSPSSPRGTNSPCPVRSSGFCSFAACACRCHSAPATVPAVARWTPMGTTERLAPRRVSELRGPCLWSAPSPGSARKQAHALAGMSGWRP